MLAKLQYISQGNTFSEQEYNVRNALDHGAGWVQVRWKNAPVFQHTALASAVKKWCESYRAVCIINDSVTIAKTVDADGVHLGLADDSILEARAQLDPGKLIGGTANSFADVVQRIDERCDYIGLGPFRFTTTKEHLSPLLGLEGYQQIIEALKKEFRAVPPIYAIGGIEIEDIECIRSAGVHGVALSRCITQQPQLISSIHKILHNNVANWR
ncbi:thiamine phosphate synthase [Niabella insulamsoli]|uniref:thiamine phosphate synthase n=1 Tax=Niabella insulamsoli TaxID=3144874 RepID=UPI0031FC2441